jgi:hypothetical protein
MLPKSFSTNLKRRRELRLNGSDYQPVKRLPDLKLKEKILRLPFGQAVWDLVISRPNRKD